MATHRPTSWDEAITDLVDQLFDIADPLRDNVQLGVQQVRARMSTPPRRSGTDPFTPRRPSDAIDSMVDLVSGLVHELGRVAQSTLDLGFGGPEPGWQRAGPPEELVFPDVRPGERSRVTMDVHNTGRTPIEEVTFSMTTLRSGGSEPHELHVGFEAHPVGRIRPGGQSTTTLQVDVPASAIPGTYRGLVQADPTDAWVVVTVKVVPAETSPHDYVE
jgi:hypothetical protein